MLSLRPIENMGPATKEKSRASDTDIRNPYNPCYEVDNRLVARCRSNTRIAYATFIMG